MGLDSPALAVQPEDLCPTRCRPSQPEKQPDRRGLPRPIGSEVADNLTLRDLELKVDQSPHPAIVLPQALRADR